MKAVVAGVQVETGSSSTETRSRLMPSPPKPWERGGVTTEVPTTAAPTSIASSTTVIESNNVPAVPARPSTLTQPLASTSLTTTSPYSNMYTSPYNRFGSTYSPFGTGYGGYGTGYGGYGGGMGGMYGGYGGMGYGGGMGFMPGMGYPQDPSQSLTAKISSTTQQTFQLLHSIVQTFGGFAQMLESTFMATHSSFFAMVGVIDQFAALRDVLGQVLGVFGLIRWVKGVLSGEGFVPPSAMTEEFQAFVNTPPGAALPAPGARPQKPSKKPLIVFFLAIFGIPYLMHKIIRRLAERAPPPFPDPNTLLTQGSVPSGPLSEQTLDPSKLSFAYAQHPFETTSALELSLKKGEIVAILNTTDPTTGLDSEWWRGRTRDGREGWFPRAFVDVIQKKIVEASDTVKKVD